MMKKTIWIIIIAAIFGIIGIYWIRMPYLEWMDDSDPNDNAQFYGSFIQGNNIVLCDDGKMEVLDMESGKRHTIIRTIRFLEGYANPSVLGDKLFWFKAWDGSSQGSLYSACKSSSSISVPEYVYSHCYVFTENRMYYVDEDRHTVVNYNYDGTSKEVHYEGKIEYLTCIDNQVLLYKSDNSRIIILDGDLLTEIESVESPGEVLFVAKTKEQSYLIQTGEKGIYLWNRENREVIPIIDNGIIDCSLFFWHPGGSRITFTQREDEIYYFTEALEIYKYDVNKMRTKTVVDLKEDKFLSDCYYENGGKDGNATIIWGKDVFAVIAGIYDYESSAYTEYIMTYDYNGRMLRKIKNQPRFF